MVPEDGQCSPHFDCQSVRYHHRPAIDAGHTRLAMWERELLECGISLPPLDQFAARYDH
jgi:hypothetical protein